MRVMVMPKKVFSKVLDFKLLVAVVDVAAEAIRFATNVEVVKQNEVACKLLVLKFVSLT